MRQDEHVWDPKGPAQVIEMRAAVDATGNLLAWESRTTSPTGPQWAGSLLDRARRG
jgi:hypothetical protein